MSCKIQIIKDNRVLELIKKKKSFISAEELGEASDKIAVVGSVGIQNNKYNIKNITKLGIKDALGIIHWHSLLRVVPCACWWSSKIIIVEVATMKITILAT